MKKTTIWVICILAIIAIATGCGNKKGNENVNNTASAVSKSKTVKLMSGDYFMKYSVVTDGEEVIVESTKKGGKSASETKASGETSRVVIDGEYVYTILDSQKMIIKNKINTNTTGETGEFSEGTDFEVTEEDAYTTGKEEIEGKSYYYEDFDGTKFCFEGDTLKFIKTEDMIIKVLECTDKSNDSMFNIPSNYKEISGFSGNTANLTGDALSGVQNIASDAEDYAKDIASNYSANIPSEYLQYLN